MSDTARKRWESRGFFEKNRDARAFVEDLLDEVDALSARLAQECALRAQAEQERNRLQHLIDCANTPLMADVLRDRDKAEARLREYETTRFFCPDCGAPIFPVTRKSDD